MTVFEQWATGHEDQPPYEPEQPRTWQRIDPASVLNGDWEPPQPTVGHRADGIGLFYPGKVHTIASETEAGKTWLALAACIDELQAGNHVLYLDFEDDIGGLVSRLLTLQVPKPAIQHRLHYVRPMEPLGGGINRDDLRALLTEHQPTIAILDGVTEAMTVHGLNPLDNADVATFGRLLPRAIAEAGPAVIALDHVTKDRETRGRYAIGGVHKINGLDGAAFVLENRTPFGVGVTGRSTIKIAKDRPGQLRRHALPGKGGMHWYGDLVLTSHDEHFAELQIDPPTERSEDFRPTHLMEKIWRTIANHEQTGGISGRDIQALVKGNAPNNRQAIAYLVVDGYITKSPHTTIKPYPPEEASE